MSAYALSDSFFFPSSLAPRNKSNEASNTKVQEGHSQSTSTVRTDGVGLNANGEVGPLHKQKSTKSETTPNTTSSSTTPSRQTPSPSEPEVLDEKTVGDKNNGNGILRGNSLGSGWYTAGSELLIAVMSASVDPIRLIQSFAESGRRAGGSLSSFATSSSSTSPACPRTPRVSNSRGEDGEKKKKRLSSSTFGNEAIKFFLSITYNGRKYTATRTLTRFLQLRDDLISEMKTRGQRRVGRSASQVSQENMSSWRDQVNSLDYDSTMVGKVSLQEDEDDTTEESSFDCEEDYDDCYEEYEDEDIMDCVIPELPVVDQNDVRCNGKDSELVGCIETSETPVPNTTTSTSVVGTYAGLGFSTLQAALRSHCSAMEHWLCQVASIVPPSSSPVLERFLCDDDFKNYNFLDMEKRKNPSSAQHVTVVPSSIRVPSSKSSRGLSSHSKSRSCICSLDCINEDEVFSNDDDEEEEEDNEGEISSYAKYA